jgi:hypothetical protein
MGVRPGELNDPNAYTTLIPRQQITPTPYALGYLNPLLGPETASSAATGNTFLGTEAGASNTTGNWNTFLGYNAGYKNTTGNYNTFSGTYAGYSNTTANYNTFSGYGVGFSNTTGHRNTFSGYGAGIYNTTGSYNTFSGVSAGRSNTTGYYNTFSGYGAGYSNTTGSYNSIFGYLTGYKNTTGSYNTFLGNQAGYSNTTGTSNTFLGLYAGYSNTTGYSNTFSGYAAGSSNTTGTSNTFLGLYAGYSNTTGSENTFSGYRAGYSNQTGVGNVFIGYRAGYYETGSNKLYVANGSAAGNVLIYGDFSTGRVGIGTTTPAYTLDVSGDIRVTGNIYGTLSETDPVFGVSPAGSIAASDITNWNTAYGWGNHALAGYLQTETDPQVGSNTTNYIPKWNGSALVSGIIYDNGNVGIGTTNPGTNRLEVTGGPIKATGGLIIETRTSDPSSPVTGQMWLRTDL